VKTAPLTVRIRAVRLFLIGTSLASMTAGALAQQAPVPPPGATQPDAQVVADPAATTASSTEQATADAASPVSDAEVIVTGSRIGRTGFTAPTPVTALSEQQLVQASPSTVAESLRTLPALVNTSGPQRNSGTVNGGQSFLDLRSLGPTRTLTLVDGRRFVTSALTGSVDVNLIPAALIQRVEVVTGGASAAYGSDAVAGVVNFILDTSYSGAKLDGYYGFSQRGDNREVKLQGALGTDFAGGRGHVVVAGEYFDNDGALPGKRGWSSRGSNLIVGPAGGPRQISRSNVLTVGTVGGMFLTGTGGTAAANAQFAGTQFLPDGSTAPYSFGSYRSGGQQIGGDGINTELIQQLVRPLQRQNVFGRVEYEIADSTKIFVEGLYGRSTTDYINAYNRHQFGNPLTIRADNAFLPAAIRAQAALTGVTGFTFLRHSNERGFVHTENDARTQRYVVGAKGVLSSWKWDAYYQYGYSKQQTDILNVENVPRFTAAIDAVVSPTTGQIVCRSTLTNPGNGCVPFNPFGANRASEAALDYVLGTSSSTSRLRQHVVAGNLSGKLLDGWAGPISLAVGGEWRRERAEVTADPFSVAGAYLFGNPQPWSGGYTVKEAYVETVVPLLANSPLGKDLELNAAGRVTDYSTSGSIWSWKAGLSYTPFDGLRLRGTRSRDIRAPNVSELFNAGRMQTASPTDPFRGGAIAQGIPITLGGNPNLKPETAQTLTVGIVVEPTQIPRLSFSVDYYNIRIKDAIQTVTPQQLLDQCFAGNQLACTQTIRDANGVLTRVLGIPINLALQQARGVDMELAYRFDLGSLIGDNSRLSLRGLVAYLDKLESTVPGSAPINRAGEVGLSPTPHWAGNASANLSSDFFSFFLQGRLIGGGKYDVTKTAADLDLQNIKPQFYLDGQISMKLPPANGKLELYVDVRNILDHDPPFAPGAGNIAIATNAALYDLVGRNFRFGLRVRL